MSEKVLLVDDEENVVAALRRQLRKRFEIVTATSGAQALETVETEGPFAVVVADMRMPVMDGIQFLGEMQKRASDTVRMMLTGNVDQKTAADAVNEGKVFRFYTKPCPAEDLADGIQAGIEYYRLITAERELLEKTLAGSVKVLIDVLSVIDPQSFGRASRMRDWAQRVAPAFGLDQSWPLTMAAMLAPLGEAVVPPEIMAKVRAEEPLTEAETAIVARIPEMGRNLIQNIPRMKPVAEIVYYHDQGYDGRGFPGDGIKGAELPIEARILKVLSDLSRVTETVVPSRREFSKLDIDQKLYDPEVLNRIRQAFPEAEDPEAKVREKFDALPVSLLRAGYILQSDLELENGRLFLAKGSQLTQTQVEQLRAMSGLSKFKEPVLVTRTVAKNVRLV